MYRLFFILMVTRLDVCLSRKYFNLPGKTQYGLQGVKAQIDRIKFFYSTNYVRLVADCGKMLEYHFKNHQCFKVSFGWVN